MTPERKAEIEATINELVKGKFSDIYPAIENYLNSLTHEEKMYALGVGMRVSDLAIFKQG